MPKALILPADEANSITQAVELIRSGGTVAFPTDTVYGLAADAFQPAAIDKLFEIKERSKNQAIAILLGSPEHLALVAEQPSSTAKALAEKHWPGALTLVITRHPDVPDILSPLPTIGVRIPDHPAAVALLKQTGPLAVTSANLSGHPNTSTAEEVFAQIGDRVDLILDGGKTPGGVPSTVVDLTGDSPKILREGPVKI